MKEQRLSGILMHISSLPGKFGIGSFGDDAYNFVKFLKLSEQKIWQILPLGHTGFGDSPYQCYSAFAGNPLFIDIDELIKSGLLKQTDISNDYVFEATEFDTIKTSLFKYPLFKKASVEFQKNATGESKGKFDEFCHKNSFWLEDYCLFTAIKAHFNDKPWYEWETEIRYRKEEAICKYSELLKQEILFYKTLQYFFYAQWMELKTYANDYGIRILGDIPLYVAYDSADAWAHADIFQFDKTLTPVAVAGVPPDYFSETGQLWGNPLFDWEKLAQTDFHWWIERIKANFSLFDILRIDHFRGLSAYWAVPYGDETAVNGNWVDAPGQELLNVIVNKLGHIPIIAEDLGVMTEDVKKLRDSFYFPGMKILQFAFDGSENNNFLPHTYTQNCVVYTGTHDNDTTLGWYQSATEKDKEAIHDYFNFKPSTVHWELIRLAWSSVANMSIAPMQDILGLGTECRMNLPGTTSGNWKWRIEKEAINNDIIEKLKKYTRIYQR